jgi:hypothetical protein
MKSISILLSIKNTSHITHHTSHITHHTSHITHLYFVFFRSSFITPPPPPPSHHNRSSRSSSSLFVGAGVVGHTRMAHQREPATRTVINVEVGAVIKAGIARAAQAELVFIALRSAFIRCQFDDGGHRRSSSSSSSPVVRSSSSHRSVVSESGATINHKVEKAFQFFSHEKS